MGIAKDLRDAIERNLPAEVSKVLQERLARADELEDECESLKNANADLSKRAEKTQKLTALAEKLEQYEQRVASRESAVTRKSELTELELECAEKRRVDSWRVIEMLLANRIIRESVQRRVPVEAHGSSDYDGNGNKISVRGGEHLEDANETTEREEG